MAINVNRVALGLRDYKINTTDYFRRVALNCSPSITPLPDGSYLICKAGGVAWFVAPTSTQVCSRFSTTPASGGLYCETDLGCNPGAISSWSCLNASMIAAGYTPSEWFVPSQAQLQNPGAICKVNWCVLSNVCCFWSCTEENCNSGCLIGVCSPPPYNALGRYKRSGCPVRAFRCVTY